MRPTTLLLIRWIPVLGVLTIALSSCVMKEQYEAEKSRALNFQRLLAQEEKRTGELDAELKRVKRDMPDLEARTRELTAQLQAVREQLARLQEENDELRQHAVVKASEELDLMLPSKGKKAKAAKPSAPAAPMVPKIDDDPLLLENTLRSDLGGDATATDGTPVYHEVKRGETLFRLSRQYGVKVQQLKAWNDLDDNMIEVGQRLIVGYE